MQSGKGSAKGSKGKGKGGDEQPLLDRIVATGLETAQREWVEKKTTSELPDKSAEKNPKKKHKKSKSIFL